MSSPVIPTFRYRDAPAAIDFLTTALGFAVQARYDEGDAVAHAQLVHGTGMVMLGSAPDEPDESGEWPQVTAAGATYLVVADSRAAFAVATAAGATVVYAPKEKDYGGWEFAVRDPEGVLWAVGEYDPWEPLDGQAAT